MNALNGVKSVVTQMMSVVPPPAKYLGKIYQQIVDPASTVGRDHFVYYTKVAKIGATIGCGLLGVFATAALVDAVSQALFGICRFAFCSVGGLALYDVSVIANNIGRLTEEEASLTRETCSEQSFVEKALKDTWMASSMIKNNVGAKIGS
jgi:hypothetical protein